MGKLSIVTFYFSLHVIISLLSYLFVHLEIILAFLLIRRPLKFPFVSFFAITWRDNKSIIRQSFMAPSSLLMIHSSQPRAGQSLLIDDRLMKRVEAVVGAQLLGSRS